MKEIVIHGAGPAGSAAALAALSNGVAVRIVEKARHGRHKVCGEFISPEACRVLDRLGVWEEFAGEHPARIRSCILHFGRVTKKWTLPECAFGLSRYALDEMLLRRAAANGAMVSQGEEPGELAHHQADASAPMIVATGRRAVAARGRRLFGFKAHFEGPVDDAVELFFYRGGYVGVSSVENGITNVCGIAPEEVLRGCGFQIDEFLAHSAALSERLRPLSRKFRWLTVGPLVFSRGVCPAEDPLVYPAGDALGFIDPFTGSGILNALLTGQLSGCAAASRLSCHAYLERCRGLLEKPYRTSSILRAVLKLDIAEHLAALVPGRWLFRFTRVGTSSVSNI